MIRDTVDVPIRDKRNVLDQRPRHGEVLTQRSPADLSVYRYLVQNAGVYVHYEEGSMICWVATVVGVLVLLVLLAIVAILLGWVDDL